MRAQEAIIDLGGAFRAFFEKRGRYPRFKKKGVRDSFCAANEAGTFRTDGEKIKLPVVGWGQAARGCAVYRQTQARDRQP